MNQAKPALKQIWHFFCTRMPLISLMGIGLCWLIYLFLPRRGHGINEFMQQYGKTMGVVVWMCMIFGVLFVCSLITFLCSKPLSGQRKWLHILLRILIAGAAIAATVFCVYISIFIFAGAGY